ncbi:MAG: winged helix-turn-helix transcriptional regulator [Elusimicrobia bacterium]|jgi:DNA-binding MarR family transcriptional regulator|nr:winged helix-turn-helix transcriptional regulator [Elusimicrobiota bacterium]
MTDISKKELRVIDVLAGQKAGQKSGQEEISQRDIAGRTGMSLGLANILINRLIKKGYVKAKKLSARKIIYIVTPKGFKQKARRSYRFMKKNLSVILKLKEAIAEEAEKKHKLGKRIFIVTGNSELADITEMVLRSQELKDSVIKREYEGFKANKDTAVFDSSDKRADKNKGKSTGAYLKAGAYVDIRQKAQELYGGEYEF